MLLQYLLFHLQHVMRQIEPVHREWYAVNLLITQLQMQIIRKIPQEYNAISIIVFIYVLYDTLLKLLLISVIE